MTLLRLAMVIGMLGPAAHATSDCENELAELKGLVTSVAAEYFAKNRRLPTVEEIERGLPKDHAWDGRGLGTMVIDLAGTDPAQFGDVKRRAAKKLMQFALAHYRFPTNEEWMAAIDWKLEPSVFKKLAPRLLGPRVEFFEYAKAELPEELVKIRNRVRDAYLRAISQRAVPKQLRTQKTRPTEERVFEMLAEFRGNEVLRDEIAAGRFTMEDFRRLIGTEPARRGQLRIATNGISEIESAAAEKSPGHFSNFRRPDIVDLARANRLLDALERKNGFLVTSVNAGIDLEEAQLATMLKYAEDRDFDIIVYPTNNVFQNLDKRLLEHRRIHVVTHTIENRHLSLYNIGLMPKNQNPFASLNKHRQFKPGQLMIVGHPQLNHAIFPTSSNHLREAAVWSTGSLSKNYYPFEHEVQDRTSRLAHNYHQNGFLVLEKADARAGFRGDGVENFWQPRSVMFKNHELDARHGFTDLGKEYFVENGKVRVANNFPTKFVKGDLHEALTDQMFLMAEIEFLSQFPPKSIDWYLHDSLDNGASNRHEQENVGLLIKKFIRGELDILRELRGLIQFDNALAKIESIATRHYIDSNHTYWLPQLLNKVTDAQAVINGGIIAELRFARDVLRIPDVLEYVLRRREGVLRNLPVEARRHFEETEIHTHDPMGIDVMPRGAMLTVGPSWRTVTLNNHGHQGANGARGSKNAHASGQEFSVVADSHQTGIQGGCYTVGTSTPKQQDYTKGGYSSWGNSSAVVYEDGTIQLLTYHTETGTMFQRPGRGVLPPDLFFGSERLKVVLNDNDRMQAGAIGDQFSRFYDRGDDTKKKRSAGGER